MNRLFLFLCLGVLAMPQFARAQPFVITNGDTVTIPGDYSSPFIADFSDFIVGDSSAGGTFVVQQSAVATTAGSY